MIWARAFKSLTPKGIFLMEQKKTESINQFTGRVEQQFKRLIKSVIPR